MHCIGELIDPIADVRRRRSTSAGRCGAPARTASIMRSDPMQMIRSTSLQRDRRSPSLPARVCVHRLHDVADHAAVLRPARRDGRPLVDAPHHEVAGVLDGAALEQVAGPLVAGEVDDAVAAAPSSPRRSRTARRCRARRRRAAPSRPSGISVGVPVGPMRTISSPGSSMAHSRDEPPISSTMSEIRPRAGSVHAPVSARPSIVRRMPSTTSAVPS